MSKPLNPCSLRRDFATLFVMAVSSVYLYRYLVLLFAVTKQNAIISNAIFTMYTGGGDGINKGKNTQKIDQ